RARAWLRSGVLPAEALARPDRRRCRRASSLVFHRLRARRRSALRDDPEADSRRGSPLLHAADLRLRRELPDGSVHPDRGELRASAIATASTVASISGGSSDATAPTRSAATSSRGSLRRGRPI